MNVLAYEKVMQVQKDSGVEVVLLQRKYDPSTGGVESEVEMAVDPDVLRHRAALLRAEADRIDSLVARIDAGLFDEKIDKRKPNGKEEEKK